MRATASASSHEENLSPKLGALLSRALSNAKAEGDGGWSVHFHNHHAASAAEREREGDRVRRKGVDRVRSLTHTATHTHTHSKQRGPCRMWREEQVGCACALPHFLLGSLREWELKLLTYYDTSLLKLEINSKLSTSPRGKDSAWNLLWPKRTLCCGACTLSFRRLRLSAASTQRNSVLYEGCSRGGIGSQENPVS